jgi:uncharacterized protein (TIGR02271 family)
MAETEMHTEHRDVATTVEAQVIELRQEDVEVQVKRVTTAKVRVASVTHTQDSFIEQPLATETVEVTRRPVGRFVPEVPSVRLEGDATIWPVFEERYVLEKRIFLVEEVHIRNIRDVRTHSEPVTSRKQDVVVVRTSLLSEQPSTNSESPMNEETIVAIFDSAEAATNVVSELHQIGIPPANISLHAANPTGAGSDASLGSAYKAEPGFWATLFGGPSEDDATYDRSMSSGSTVVTVKCQAGETDGVMSVLERHHPIDIDERGQSYMGSTHSTATAGAGMAGTTSATGGTFLGTEHAAASTGVGAGTAADGKLELAEESLTVGKRAVNMGTARVRRYVVETPVSEDVRLRDETVTIERRPVTDGRKVTDADFTDKVIEMDETREEAVVSKTARVVEEVAINKQATERTETVRDTVKRDEVEITKPGATGGTAYGSTSGTGTLKTGLDK